MIDVIIPAYNAHATINRTLYSIVNQKNAKDLNVYIVNDASDKDYHEQVERFSKYIKIKELKLSENRGPGYARQYGIDHSNNKYIVFIDSDDTFYDYFSLQILVDTIEKENTDLVISNFWEERNESLKVHNKEMFFMHGKIYRRSFIVKNNIRFFDTRSDEDTGFNYLLLFNKPKISYINMLTYIWIINKKSISRSSDLVSVVLKNYIHNVELSIEEAKKRNLDKKEIDKAVMSCLTSIYYYYNNLKDDRLFEYLKNIYSIYKTTSLTQEEQDDSLIEMFLYNQNYLETRNIYNLELTFNQFLNRLEEMI